MKTVGEILSAARCQQKISLEKLSQITKIDTRYIKALEENDCDKFPTSTFIKGFIRNLSLALGKNPDEMIAIFRRDYPDNCHHFQKPLTHFSLHQSIISHPQFFIIIFAIIIFFGYLAFQYRLVLLPPKLEVVKPQPNQVLALPVIVEGFSSVDSTISINGQREITPDSSGHFLYELDQANGQFEIKISATNRFGRIASRTIPITVLSQ